MQSMDSRNLVFAEVYCLYCFTIFQTFETVKRVEIPLLKVDQLVVFPASFRFILWSCTGEKLSWFIRHYSFRCHKKVPSYLCGFPFKPHQAGSE